MTLEAFLSQGHELPTLPEIYLKVSEMLDDDSVSAEKIGETVQTDPAIASRLLKMVNSAYYGLPNRVSSAKQSVAMLGRLRLKHILIGSVLGGVFRNNGDENFPLQPFWQHSIQTAIIARELTRHLPQIEDAESIFTAGLLHDIGRLILASRVPDFVDNVDQIQLKKRISIIEAEQELLGFDHTQLTVALMLEWQMPDNLIDCVKHHHETIHSGPHCRESALIYLSNCLAHAVPPIDEEDTLALLDEISNWEFLGLTAHQIGEACQLADEMVFEVMESLGMVDMVISSD
jgi:putative nucleotidyltransferase with HDIG domain